MVLLMVALHNGNHVRPMTSVVVQQLAKQISVRQMGGEDQRLRHQPCHLLKPCHGQCLSPQPCHLHKSCHHLRHRLKMVAAHSNTMNASHIVVARGRAVYSVEGVMFGYQGPIPIASRDGIPVRTISQDVAVIRYVTNRMTIGINVWHHPRYQDLPQPLHHQRSQQTFCLQNFLP